MLLLLVTALTGGVLGLGALVAVGVALAVAASRFVESLLYQTEAVDPAIYVGVVAVLGVVALVSALIPALRATRVDPVIALKAE